MLEPQRKNFNLNNHHYHRIEINGGMIIKRHHHNANLHHLHQYHQSLSSSRFLPFTYVLLAGVSFTSCFLLSWFTFIDRNGIYISENFQLFALRQQRQLSRTFFYFGINSDDNSTSYNLNMSSADYDDQAAFQATVDSQNDARLENLFQQRRTNLESTCRRRYPKQRISHPQMLLNRNGKPFNQRLPSNLYVSEPLKLVFCSIPKVASSNWYKYFDNLSRNATFTGLHNVTFNESLPVLKSITSYSADAAKSILETYRKIMWVREPLERLVSAWRDKLSIYNPYYSKVVGSVVIKGFRPNATKAEIAAGYPTSLEEFFKYLKFQQRTRYDVHWRPYYFACAPCNLPLMQFDYIGHLENIHAEAGYVIRQLTKRADYPPFPSGYRNRTSESLLKEYISKVPKTLVEQVLRNFYIDYELYGYTIPKF